ncbi:MAG: hypothetical protein JO340_19700 [Acidobacteriaceae bacterium]|nr:hypothetical protein [Acidobacteriaceae bacterium]
MPTSLLLSAETKTELHETIRVTFGDPGAILAALPDPAPPCDVTDWLSRLKLLYGVPFNYLVPDEGMLPPESIRFFYLDLNWVDALIDGAFSIGRNLTTTAETASLNLDRAVNSALHASIAFRAPAIRARLLGRAARRSTHFTLQTVSGFVLRSSIVSAYRNLGVNVYPSGATPEDAQPTRLELLRLEALGPKSDTLLCLVDGDAHRVDIHEAPEHLHYALDSYAVDPLKAFKTIRKFEVKDGKVTIHKDDFVKLDLTKCLRPASPRTLNITAVAQQIAEGNGAPQEPLDSAEMGFAMTEGVGLVSFLKRNTT